MDEPDGFEVTGFVMIPPTAAIPRRRFGRPREELVRISKGESKFRRAILQMCGLVCAVTGRCPAGILEAARIRPFAKRGIHELKDGISLRADIHQLFDAGRVAIDPDKLVLVTQASAVLYQCY